MGLFDSHVPDTVGDPEVPAPGQTPPPARAPRTAGRIDLDDWDTPGEPAPRRWLLVAALVPWLVVLAMVLAEGRSDGDGDTPAPTDQPTAPAENPPGQAATTPPAPTPSASPAAGPPTGATVVALGGSTGPGPLGQARAHAAVVARAWLSTRPAGPGVAGLDPAPGADQRYVEHLTIEAVDHPARGALVVSVRAVVLPVEGDAYGTARQVRLAVPLTVEGDRVRPAGPPWLLPTTDLAIEPPTTTPVDDVDLMVAAAEAVAEAGYRDVELETLERSSGWPWVAHVRARGPGQDAPTGHVVWLRSDVGRLVVAGTAPTPPGAPPTTGTPTTTPTAVEEVAP